MGAWGEGPFDNDGSLDAIGGLRDAGGDGAEEYLRQVFREVLEADYVESHEAQGAVGIAALLAHLRIPSDDPATLRAAEGVQLTVTPELCELAARGLRRIQKPDDNEWFELWDEGGDGFGETMVRSLDPLLDALGGQRSAGTPTG